MGSYHGVGLYIHRMFSMGCADDHSILVRLIDKFMFSEAVYENTRLWPISQNAPKKIEGL
jgi:hypothetical protein